MRKRTNWHGGAVLLILAGAVAAWATWWHDPCSSTYKVNHPVLTALEKDHQLERDRLYRRYLYEMEGAYLLHTPPAVLVVMQADFTELSNAVALSQRREWQDTCRRLNH